MSDTRQIVSQLGSQQHATAQLRLANWVLRDTQTLDQTNIAKAVAETLILRLAHGWFAVLFWYALAGPLGALAYRLIDELHLCWNRKLGQYEQFGRPIQQLFNYSAWLPDYLLALFMCLFGSVKNNWHNRRLGFRWPRPVSGQLIGVAASWLNAELGGSRQYAGRIVHYPKFGPANQPPLASDFRPLILRCYLISANFTLLIVYPLLLARYVLFS